MMCGDALLRRLSLFEVCLTQTKKKDLRQVF